MSLRNTDNVYGLVLYTGHESKLLMNSARARYKISKVMKTTYKSILIIIFFQLAISMLAGGVGASWTYDNLNSPYLEL
jgi:phospholipid-transporting ATPase